MRPAVVAAASSSMGMDQVGSRAHNLSAAVAARDTVPGVVAVDTTENRCAGRAATARRALCMSNGDGYDGPPHLLRIAKFSVNNSKLINP
jgi:hypothetical protein